MHSHTMSTVNSRIELLKAENEELSRNLISAEEKLFKTNEDCKKFKIETNVLRERIVFLE